ncbi:MAG TPA: hypothetical protein VFQ61_12915 [Polyangiaceae bacterium]|nr:hypothetical protein [Polyangiaceae bacterium]
MADPRYDRQCRLREVGELGQARIESSAARVPPGPSAAPELAFLARAGVERAAVGTGIEREFSHAVHFRFSAPAALARGAEGALLHLLHALNSE